MLCGIWQVFMLDQVLDNIFMFSPNGLGMKAMFVKSGCDFKLGRTRSALEELVRVQN